MPPDVSVFEMVGGEATFHALVDRFYAKIAADPVLRPIFPDHMDEGKRWQYLFLVQLFGGNTQYNVERGHPRLRMRHMPFFIDQQARDRWLTHMLAAMDEVGIVEPAFGIMKSYFERAATQMINRWNVEP
jgi:hemoglobin